MSEYQRPQEQQQQPQPQAQVQQKRQEDGVRTKWMSAGPFWDSYAADLAARATGSCSNPRFSSASLSSVAAAVSAPQQHQQSSYANNGAHNIYGHLGSNRLLLPWHFNSLSSATCVSGVGIPVRGLWSASGDAVNPHHPFSAGLTRQAAPITFGASPAFPGSQLVY
jgi:hypothetical protein